MGGPSHFTSRTTYATTYATTQSSQPSSICAGTTVVPRSPQKKVQVGTGRVLGRKTTNARGTPFVTERDNSSSHLPPLSGHKRPYSFASFAAATGGNRRPTTSFGVYSDRTTGAQVFNLGTSSEKILHGPTKLKSASPTNIDIGFKPRGLKWKGKDAVSTSQLHQMKANKKKKGSCGTSEK
uniref:Transposon MuDR mudrA n=1 Tax=Solanum tuberosum TaxID=4113 RepID=M1DJL0_SOLTU